MHQYDQCVRPSVKVLTFIASTYISDQIATKYEQYNDVYNCVHS